VEPNEVNTVSNVRVSVEKESLSAGLVVIVSFLQDIKSDDDSNNSAAADKK
jgi:hypothetical protein